SALSQPVTVTLNLTSGTYSGTDVSPPANMTLVINGAGGQIVFQGHSPALTVASGTVIVTGGTFVNATDAPTIRGAGGHFTVRGRTIRDMPGYARTARQVPGGTVDLGTATHPGGNTLNINGACAFVVNTAGLPIAAAGDTFLVNGVPLAPDSLSGIA